MQATKLAGLMASHLLFSCANSSPATPNGPATSTSGTGTGTTGASSSGGAAGASGLFFLEGPSFNGSEVAATAQVGILAYETSLPARGQAIVRGGDEEWTLTLPEAINVEKPVLGLKPSTEYTLELIVSDDRETLSAPRLSWSTPDLPGGFPLLSVVTSEPELMEPGMTLFNARGPVSDSMVIIDHEGTVRWYNYDLEHRVQEDHRRLESGNFIYIRDQRLLVEVDVTGNEVAYWHAASFPQMYEPPSGSTPVEVDTFHHEASQLENGNFLVLSTEVQTVEDFPTSDTDPNAATRTEQVVGTVVVEFAPSGEVVKRIPLLSLLDPRRVGRDSLGRSAVYGGEAVDWAHGNAVAYDESDDSYYVSLRHQDAIVKIDRGSETLRWIFGPPDNWNEPWASLVLTPVGDLTFPYHQHAVELTPEGFGLYDNGNYRASAFQTPSDLEYSRVAVYAPDEAALTVTQVWDYGAETGDASFFSALMGDADWQPITGNVLITNSVLYTEKFGGSAYGQLLEVTQDGRRVFEFDVGDPEASGTAIHAIYRAQRLEDIRQ